MIGKKKAALILSMVLASSLYGVAGAAEVQAPVWLMDNENDPVVFDGDKPTIVFNGEDPEHANGALVLTATNKTITTQNGAPLTIKVDRALPPMRRHIPQSTRRTPTIPTPMAATRSLRSLSPTPSMRTWTCRCAAATVRGNSWRRLPASP